MLDAGPDNVPRIVHYIHIGALAFMHRRYKIKAALVAGLILGMYLSPL